MTANLPWSHLPHSWFRTEEFPLTTQSPKSLCVTFCIFPTSRHPRRLHPRRLRVSPLCTSDIFPASVGRLSAWRKYLAEKGLRKPDDTQLQSTFSQLRCCNGSTELHQSHIGLPGADARSTLQHEGLGTGGCNITDREAPLHH